MRINPLFAERTALNKERLSRQGILKKKTRACSLQVLPTGGRCSHICSVFKEQAPERITRRTEAFWRFRRCPGYSRQGR
jgi:hypothetical protein